MQRVGPTTGLELRFRRLALHRKLEEGLRATPAPRRLRAQRVAVDEAECEAGVAVGNAPRE